MHSCSLVATHGRRLRRSVAWREREWRSEQLAERRRPVRHVLVILAVAALACLVAPDIVAQEINTANTSERRWVVHAGVGSPHAWNFIGGTREFSGGPLRLFATAGFGSFLVGGGVAYYTNPGSTGLILAAAVGLAGAHVAAVLDLKLTEKAGIVVGGSYGNYFLQYQGLLPIASFQMRF